MPTPKPKDIIAAATILTFAALKLAGLNGTVDGAFLLIVGYYFAHRKDGDDKGI